MILCFNLTNNINLYTICVGFIKDIIHRKKIKLIENITNKLINTCSNKSSSFLDRLYYLIETVIPYSYPENKDEYIPCFKKPVSIEKNRIINRYNYKKTLKRLKTIFDLQGLEFTYNNLSDEYSKEIFLMVIVYRLFEDVKLRFPLYYTFDFRDDKRFDHLLIDETILKTSQFEFKKYNLSNLGVNLKLWLNAGSIVVDFILKQYSYEDKVIAQEGDYVIEGGGCFGDTALYYADLVKESGKVFSFEFLEDNLEVFNKNIELNPHYKDIVEIIERPLGPKSNQMLYAKSYGSATRVIATPVENSKQYASITIDDFVKEKNMPKIDFIKLDIEGCEMDVLKASVNTLKTFKPKLAICLYHRNSDFWQIPKFIKELVPEYNLYLKHNTVSTGETVLYAGI